MGDKKTICLDFDGIFNNYQGYDGDNIGPPRHNIDKFLQVLHKDFYIIVCSVRRYSIIINWLAKHDLLKYVDNVTSIKPKASVYLDDRGLTFNGDFEESLKQIYKFKAYWEK